MLNLVKRAETNPWLQIEMCMDRDEWLGFIEYMCAPFDPKLIAKQVNMGLQALSTRPEDSVDSRV